MLTVAIVLAHVGLLRTLPVAPGFDDPLAARPFVTRSIEWRPVVLPSASLSVPVAKRTSPVLPPAPQRTGTGPNPQTQTTGDAAASAEPPAQATTPQGGASAVQAGQAPVAIAPVAAAGMVPEPASAVAANQAPRTAAALASDMSGATQRLGPVAVPGSVRLKFRVTGEYRGQPQGGSGELTWRHDGQAYEARMAVGNLFRTRVQVSQGTLGPAGLAPARFSDKAGSERAAHFVDRGSDGQGGHVVFSANSPTVPLAPGAQDRLSVLLQMGAMLAGDPARRVAGQQVTVQVVGAREADVWTFVVEGEERLALGSGVQAGLKLTRTPRRDYDQKVELWLGSGMGYLPIRLRVTEANGNFLDQQLISLEPP